MAEVIHLRSVVVDLNACPTIESEPVDRPKSRDYSEVLRKVTGVNATSFTCSLICTLCDLVFTLITLGIGAANQSACPAEPLIPIYLVVSATVNLLNIGVSTIACTVQHRNRDARRSGFRCVHGSALVIIALQLFSLIWLILGNIWVFRIFSTVQYVQVNLPSYCKGSVYQFTIASVILQYVLPLIFCCCKSLPCRS